jgi:hypothetical protein
MVSAEQRWNESRREHNRAMHAYHEALRARNNVNYILRRTQNAAKKNIRRAQLVRAQSNLNRAQMNIAAATARTTNAYRNLTRKYHLPIGLPVETLNAVLMNIVQNEKARARHRGKVRELLALFPPNVANKIVRLA